MLRILLETWGKRYAFRLDRAARIADFKLGDLITDAEEMEDGAICVSLVQGERLYLRIGGAADSAKVIEALMFPEAAEVTEPPDVKEPSKPWWRFW
jgi:hypothetical protein